MNRKRYSLLENLAYYKVVQYALSLWFLYMVKDLIFIMVSNYLDIHEGHYLYRFLLVIVYGAIFGLWGYAVFQTTRARRYRRLTGRSYSTDHGIYHRSYGELVWFFKDADPYRMNPDFLPEMSWRECHGLVLGKVGNRLICFEPDGDGIILFCWGRPKVGKTTCFIIPCARQFGLYHDKDGTLVQKGSCMVLDLKGDVYDANHKYRNIKRFSVKNWKTSCHFDPLVTARAMNEDERADFLDNLAITIIPDEEGADSTYFNEVARAFFTGIFLYCLHNDICRSFADICEEITVNSFQYWGEKIEASDLMIAMKYVVSFKDENERNVGGGYGKLVRAVRLYTSARLKALLSNDGEQIKPEDLENCTDVYIQLDVVDMPHLSPLVAMLFETFMEKALLRQDHQNPPIAYIFDEFGQLPQMPIISTSAAMCRSKNVSICIGCQSLVQIDKHYGENGRKELVDCSFGHCIMSLTEPDTRKWASELIGSKKVLKTGSSEQQDKSVGRSSNEDRELVFQPEDFGALPHYHAAIIYYDGYYIKAETTYCENP